MIGIPGSSSRTDPLGLNRRVVPLAALAGWFGAGVGTIVLLGWLLGVSAFKSILPGLARMQPNTALSLCLTGLALLGMKQGGVRGRSQRIAWVLAGLAAAIGTLTLFEYASGIDFGIDLLLFGMVPGSEGPPSPGRMSFMTATCIASLGAALLLLDAEARFLRRASQAFTLTTTLLALLDLIGYAYGVRFLYMVNAYSTMALHTALTLFILGVGTLAARPGSGLMPRFLADDAGGWLLRNLLPLTVALPLLTGGLRVAGEEWGLFNPRFGSAVLVLGNIVSLIGLLWWTAGRLSHLDGEARRAARAVSEREAWLGTTLASIGDAVIATDPEGRVVFINPVAETMTGWTQADAVGLPLEEVFRIVDETHRRPVENPALRAIGEGATVGLASHTVLTARDGTERAIDDSAAPIRFGDGPIAGAVLVFRDVSSRRLVELALSRNEQRLRMGLDAARMVAWEWTPADGSLRVSENATNVFGLPQGTTLIRIDQGIALLHPDDIPAYHETYQKAIDERAGYLTDYRLIRPDDGRVLWMEERGHASCDESGRVERLFGVVMDVTERHQVEERLRDALSRLDSILTASEVGTWEYDAVADVVRGDPIFARMFGVSPEVAAGGPIEEYVKAIHPDDRAHVDDAFRRSLASGIDFEAEYRIGGPGEAALRVVARARIRRDGSGKVVGLPGVVIDITGQKRAEEELREARSRLESTLSAGEVGTWVFDVVNDVVRADSNLARMFGVTSEEASGGLLDAYTRAIHPDDRGRVTIAIGRALESGEVFEAEYRIVGATGEVRWVVARGRIERDEAGRALRLPGVVIDVTGQRKAEEGLRASEERRRLALDSAELGTWSIDPVTSVLTTDERFRTIFLGSPAPFDLEEAFGVIHPDDRGRVRESVAAAMTPHDPASYVEEYRVVRPDGTTRWVFAKGGSNFETTAVGRRLVSFDGTVMDITDRKRAERRLEESEARLRFALKAGRMGTWDLDLASGVMTCSETCKANYGRGPSDSFGYEELAASVLPEDRPMWRQAVNEAIDGASGLDVEYRTRWPDGSVHWVCVRASCATDEGGRTVAMSGVSFGIDDRKRMEEGLREMAADLSEADHRKDDFLATLAHELRNPLAPIRNGLQIMKMAGDDRRAVDESRSLMERQVTHMVRLIDDLMDVSRITRNKLELRRERVDLAVVVRSAVETSRPLVEESGHELIVTLPARPILVDADVTRLSQVFSNLLNNAAKYTERGGDIALVAERQGSVVVVTVRDNGLGIPPDMLPKLFEMFTQVDRSLERSQGGLGIGLALVKTLVEMHGGSVEARSGGHGQGSEFVVRLPVVLSAPMPDLAPEPSAGQVGPPAALRILVVDDNVDSARTLARLLKLLGHETRTAHDGGEAVEAAEQYRPELMLLDIGLPVMNGYEVARAIRGRPWGRGVTIVALTGWGQEGDRRRSKEAEIDDHLVKPVDPATLESLIAGLRPEADSKSFSAPS